MKNDTFLKPAAGWDKNKTGGILVKRVLMLERRTADWLNDKTKALSGKAMLCLLIVFCTLGTAVCLALILGKI
jgi:hypothetical protein